MSDPTSNTTKTVAAGVGAAAVLAVALLVGRHPATTPPPVTASTDEQLLASATRTIQMTTAQMKADNAAMHAAGGLLAGNPDDLNTPQALTDAQMAAAGPQPIGPAEQASPLCDKSALVDVPPDKIAEATAWGCVAGTAMWNPAPHGINWNIDPQTIRENFKAASAEIVAGQLPVTLHTFPCAVTTLAVTWNHCRIVTVGAPFSGGVLHATAAASLVEPHWTAAPTFTAPPGAVLLRCGMTGRDEAGRVIYLTHGTGFNGGCTVAEILLGPGAWRGSDGVAHAAKEGSEQ